MFTRKDYLSGVCTHKQYYSQFVTDEIIKLVKDAFKINTLVESYHKDSNLNNLPLSNWDRLTNFLPSYVSAGFKNVGDYLTLAGGVCLLKQAARIAVENFEYVESSIDLVEDED